MESSRSCITVMMVILFAIRRVTLSNVLKNSSDCSSMIVLDCTVIGGAATIWQGTIFDQCQGRNDILLRHSQFSSGGVINVTCDRNLSISGQAISVNANTSMFTSRLIIHLHEDLSGRTVECANESKGIIGSYMISLEPGSSMGINISLTNISDNDTLTFAWNSRSVHDDSYHVNSSNCGVCPNTTNVSSVICNGFAPLTPFMSCTLTVQGFGDGLCYEEVISDPFEVKGPDITNLTISIEDNGQTGMFQVLFHPSSESVSSSHAAGIKTQYEITFKDSCLNTILDHESCGAETCMVKYHISNLSCPSSSDNITVIVFATNVLGEGPQHTAYLSLKEFVYPQGFGTEPSNAQRNLLVISLSILVVLAVALAIIIAMVVIKISIKKRNSTKFKPTEDVQVSLNALEQSNDPGAMTLEMAAPISPGPISLQPSSQYSLLTSETDDKGLTYADIGEITTSRFKVASSNIEAVEYAQINHNATTSPHSVDDLLDLDNLLIQVQKEMTGCWYQFGKAVGVPDDLLNKCTKCSSEQSVIEVLDYWLRDSGEQRKTWRDVADALKMIGHISLAKRIMRIYETDDSDDELIPPPLPPRAESL